MKTYYLETLKDVPLKDGEKFEFDECRYMVCEAAHYREACWYCAFRKTSACTFATCEASDGTQFYFEYQSIK